MVNVETRLVIPSTDGTKALHVYRCTDGDHALIEFDWFEQNARKWGFCLTPEEWERVRTFLVWGADV